MVTASPIKLLFVTLASNTVGLGHLNRCLSIAEATDANVSCKFFVFGDEFASKHLKLCGSNYAMAPLGPTTDSQIRAALAKAAKQADVVIVDVVHSKFFAVDNPTEVFEVLRPFASTIAAIDSLGDLSLAVRTPEIPIDVLVLPYVLSNSDRTSAGRVGRYQLLGSDYALLPPEYFNPPKQLQRALPKRVLVTCGGSDPMEWTPVIISGLNLISRPLDLRIIIGPFFCPDLKDMVGKLAAESRHNVMLVDAPVSLMEHMLWCDLAVAASGLTKYELAATGTPTLLFSIDALHATSNQSFSEMGSVVDLGAGPTLNSIADQTKRLLDDKNLRTKLAAAGRNLVDGGGAQRLVAKLVKDLSCQKTS